MKLQIDSKYLKIIIGEKWQVQAREQGGPTTK